MGARAISSATISFGLVSIPIKVYSTSATSSDIRFNMLHDKCGTRVKQQYICPKSGEVVARENRIKGYEFSKGQFVTFTDDELKAFDVAANRAVEISEFVPAEQVDPLHFEKTYFLGPDAGGERAYRLLGAAMRHTNRCAVARYATRGKQYVVMLRPYKRGIAMQQLRYPHEVKDFAEVPLGVTEGEVQDSELKLATQLIEQITSEDFDMDRYQDGVRVRIEEAIEQKISGVAISVVHDEAPKAQIIDLMEALKASLGGAEQDTDEEMPGRRPAKKAGAKKTKTKAKTQKKTAT